MQNGGIPGNDRSLWLKSNERDCEIWSTTVALSRQVLNIVQSNRDRAMEMKSSFRRSASPSRRNIRNLFLVDNYLLFFLFYAGYNHYIHWIFIYYKSVIYVRYVISLARKGIPTERKVQSWNKNLINIATREFFLVSMKSDGLLVRKI